MPDGRNMKHIVSNTNFSLWKRGGRPPPAAADVMEGPRSQRCSLAMARGEGNYRGWVVHGGESRRKWSLMLESEPKHLIQYCSTRGR